MQGLRCRGLVGASSRGTPVAVIFRSTRQERTMIDPTASLSTLAGRSSASGIERSQNADDQFSQEVTIEDIIRSWGESDSHADMNADGIVDVNDLLLLLEQQSSSNPVLSSLSEVPEAIAGGLASLGGLLIEALGITSESESTSQKSVPDDLDVKPEQALQSLDPEGVDQAMKTAKGLIDRWQARGWSTSPPPGFEQLLETLPLEPNVRSVVASLIEMTYAT